jgi:hypothetical protein
MKQTYRRGILLAVLVVWASACICNPSTLIDKLVNKAVEKSVSEMEKTGNVTFEYYGVSFTVPEGYTATSMFGVAVSPKGSQFGAPSFSVDNYPNEAEKNEYDWWINSYRTDSEYKNLTENPITVDGIDGMVFEYQAEMKNFMNLDEKFNGTGVSIILNDTANNQAVMIQGAWKDEDNDAARPIFDQWLKTVKLFAPKPLPTREPTAQ